MNGRWRDALPAGTKLAGYVIGRTLGRGAFGITYYGTKYLFPEVEVAIKEFLPRGHAMRTPGAETVYPTDPDEFQAALASLETEAWTLKDLRHPNVAEVQDFLLANGTAYLVMKYEAGTSLADLLTRRKGSLAEAEILDILPPLLDGLEAVHAKGYLHRDIKPGNIYRRAADGSTVLLDFGAARKAMGDKQHSRLTQILTPGYAPPEQYPIDGEQRAFTDIYAVGATLYCCITGASPPESVLRAHAVFHGQPDPMVPAAEAGRGRYSAPFLAAIDKMLLLNEQKRPQSVAQLRNLLMLTAEEGDRTNANSDTINIDSGGDSAQPVPPAERRRLRFGPALALAAFAVYAGAILTEFLGYASGASWGSASARALTALIPWIGAVGLPAVLLTSASDPRGRFFLVTAIWLAAGAPLLAAFLAWFEIGFFLHFGPSEILANWYARLAGFLLLLIAVFPLQRDAFKALRAHRQRDPALHPPETARWGLRYALALAAAGFVIGAGAALAQLLLWNFRGDLARSITALVALIVAVGLPAGLLLFVPRLRPKASIAAAVWLAIGTTLFGPIFVYAVVSDYGLLVSGYLTLEPAAAMVGFLLTFLAAIPAWLYALRARRVEERTNNAAAPRKPGIAMLRWALLLALCGAAIIVGSVTGILLKDSSAITFLIPGSYAVLALILLALPGSLVLAGRRRAILWLALGATAVALCWAALIFAIVREGLSRIANQDAAFFVFVLGVTIVALSSPFLWSRRVRALGRRPVALETAFNRATVKSGRVGGWRLAGAVVVALVAGLASAIEPWKWAGSAAAPPARPKVQPQPAAVPPQPSGLATQAPHSCRDAAGWRAGCVFRDCPECPEMVVVPAGTFTMGSPETEPGRYDTEGPRRPVTIAKPLAVGRFELTRGEWRDFVNATNYQPRSDCFARTGLTSVENWRDVGFEQTDRHPVVCVSYDDATAYLSWLSRKALKDYRLPSEAEWEYAARANTATPHYWTDIGASVCQLANIADAAWAAATKQPLGPPRCSDGYAFTAPVGSFRANAFGLHDVIGNVREWVADCWNPTYAGAPVNGAARLAGDCNRRVYRSSAWVSAGRDLRVAWRDATESNRRNLWTGFRVARALD